MAESFVVFFREALECALFIALMSGCPSAAGRARWLLAGVASALLSGFALGYLPGASDALLKGEAWSYARYAVELALLYLGLVLAVRKPYIPAPLFSPALFLLGFALFFFESRTLGFFAHDTGIMQEDERGTLIAAALGLAAGFGLLAAMWKHIKALPLERALTAQGLLVLVAALKFAMGGVGEVEEGNVLTALQRGLQAFNEGAVGDLQRVLMLGEHEFMRVPLTGLAGFLKGDRTAMALMLVIVMAPPVYVLIDIFSRPDPDVSGLGVAAERRLRVAFFRRELLWRSLPVFVSFGVTLMAMHALNASMNPMYEPMPVPVRESEERTGLIIIPLSDQMGDLADEKLRKYVYYYGEKQIIFLAVMKPDGTVGLALDECEICRPADWNKAAQGYAQASENLVCKYCMTPIAVSTVNKPGGCNPIPLPFALEERSILVKLDDLIRTWKEARKLEKKGTHL